MRATLATGSGFTLLELLVVLAIIAAITATMPLAFARVAPSIQVRIAAESLSDALRVGRALALREQRTIALTLVGSPCRLMSEAVVVWECPPSVEVAPPTGSSASAAVVNIYADGSSSGADFAVSLHGHHAFLNMSRMTSRVTNARS